MEMQQNTPASALFIVGGSRCGKSLLAELLRAYAPIFVFRELHFFERCNRPSGDSTVLDQIEIAKLYCRLLQISQKGILEASDEIGDLDPGIRFANRLDRTRLTALEVFLAFLRDVADSEIPESIPCDQTGANVFYLDRLLEAMPGAKVVRMVRDPRAVLHARKDKWRIVGQPNKSIPFRELLRQQPLKNSFIATRIWKNYIFAGNCYEKDPRVLTVKFEDLVSHPSEIVGRVCSFLGVTRKGIDVVADSVVNTICLEGRRIGPQIRPEEVYRWRNQRKLSPTEIYICQRIASREMQSFGYAIDNINPNIVTLVLSAGRLLFDLVLAVSMNIGRAKTATVTLWNRFINRSRSQI